MECSFGKAVATCRLWASMIGPQGLCRLTATPAAAELIRSLVEEHGPVMFHQSGGCCDGSGFSLEAPRGVRFLLRSSVCLPEDVP